MSLFKKESCILCNEEVSALSRFKLNNGQFLCNKCVLKVNFTDGWTADTLKSSSLDEIKNRIEFVEKDLKENAERVTQFKPSIKYAGYMWFDDEHKWFVIPKGTFSFKIDNCYIFRYDEILDYEVLEDGTSITKGGLGKSLVGGAIFGLAGAMAGGTSKHTKQICNKLQLKITTKKNDRPVIYIDLINTEFKKDGFVYKTASKSIQDIISKIQLIQSQLETNTAIINETNISSIADEIKKFKDLLDMGAISQEEFEKKKKELLG